MSRRKFLSSLKDLDAYAKPLDDFQVKTLTGATVTLLASVLVAILLFSEFVDWNTVDLQPSIQVDHGRKEKMAIHLNVSFPHIPCFLVGIDVMDVSGDHQNDVDHDMFKQRLDRQGNPVHPVEKGRTFKKTHSKASETSRRQKRLLRKRMSLWRLLHVDRVTAGNCPLRGVVIPATTSRKLTKPRVGPWTIWKNINRFLRSANSRLQCIDDGEAQKLKEQENEGCNIHGKLQINKVGGNIHFAPGKSYTQNSVHAHDLHEYVKGKNYDWTHIIHELGFGENVGFKNPLDSVKKESSQGSLCTHTLTL